MLLLFIQLLFMIDVSVGRITFGARRTINYESQLQSNTEDEERTR
jgi:hypothetical protein